MSKDQGLQKLSSRPRTVLEDYNTVTPPLELIRNDQRIVVAIMVVASKG